MKKLIIIPAYNESSNIERTVEAIIKDAPDFDYVIINDCSKDNTLEICQKNGFNVVSLPINLGIGGAVQTGYLYAKKNGYDIAVQVDGDGQHNPSFLNQMVEELKNNQVDMVIGSRFIKNEGFQSSFARRIGIRYFTWLIKLMTGTRITDATSGLRMINRGLIERFADNYPDDYPEPETVVEALLNDYKVKEIPVIMNERQGGVSSISMSKSVYYMIKVTMAILFVKLRGKQ
ncbi:glycosyltransferase family 2 protein [Streptococcus orisratti]|uniref:glycosyltransferase family 2 protein n=1 Tax=Streptococcus orisratti TaxID=114652 RepID=UPI000378F9FE|nr:glycosyltransferase family 2 protein [Streptococcus orisratti]